MDELLSIKEERARYQREYRRKNAVELAKKDRERYVRNKDAVVRRQQTYYQRNKDSIKEKALLRYRANVELFKQRSRDHRRLHPGRSKEWRDKHPEYEKNWRAAHPKAGAANAKKYRDSLRKRIIEGYGGECACCGEKEGQFLEIDHVNGGGTEHRKRLHHGPPIYKLIIEQNFPVDFQLLCSNCNQGRHLNGGKCPHRGAVNPPNPLRARFLSAYGNKCECCGETGQRFLAGDHINSDGAKCRLEYPGPIAQWAATNRYPKGAIRLLCHNCNSGRAHNGGVCPHEDHKNV